MILHLKSVALCGVHFLKQGKSTKKKYVIKIIGMETMCKCV